MWWQLFLINCLLFLWTIIYFNFSNKLRITLYINLIDLLLLNLFVSLRHIIFKRFIDDAGDPNKQGLLFFNSWVLWSKIAYQLLFHCFQELGIYWENNSFHGITKTKRLTRKVWKSFWTEIHFFTQGWFFIIISQHHS